MTFNTRPTRSLGLAAMLALAATNTNLPVLPALAPRRSAPPPKDKEAQMRRELADCQENKARITAAKEKRERKNAKRLADAKKVGSGTTAPEGHNVAIEGPEQAQLANGPARMEGSTP